MISIEETELEAGLKHLLQKQVCFRIGGKPWKSGKFLLFNQSNFYIELILDTVKKRERFEIPVPFSVEQWKEDGLLYLDYTFKTISKNNAPIISLISSLSVDKKSRFYNTILEIEAVDEV